MLDKTTAFQFAVMVTSGMPTRDALGYFVPAETSPDELEAAHNLWTSSKLVREALVTLQGKPWQEMSVEEMVDWVLAKTYKEMAYYLYANNYAELTGHERQKADTCRQALEAKKAGTAGQLNVLETWLADLKAGRITTPMKRPMSVAVAS